jgi:uncharacterized protein YkwD
MRSTVLVLGSAVCIMACAGSPAPLAGVKSPFPTREEIAQLTVEPMPARPVRAVRIAREWEIGQKRAADAFAPSVLERAWNAHASQATFRPELHCVAYELARYVAEQEGEPDERLRRWIAGACNVSTLDFVANAATALSAPPSVSDAQVIEAAMQPEKFLQSPLDRKGNFGVAIIRKGTRVVVGLARMRAAETSTFSEPDAAGVVNVTTEVGANDNVVALINQGAHGVAPCTPKKQEGSRLLWSCAMAPADPFAWISLGATPKGQLLMRPIALALARRNRQEPIHYVSEVQSELTEDTDASLAKKLFDGINQRRTEARLPKLVEAKAQSQGDNTRLAPHFFHALASANVEKADKVLLGLMAGWDVAGTIRNASVFGSFQSGAKAPSAWLLSALETPMGRHSLLSTDAQQLALGVTTVSTLGGLGVLVSCYTVFEGRDHATDAKLFVAHVNALRAQKGLPPATWVDASEALHKAVMRTDQGAPPIDVMRDALDQETEQRQSRVIGITSPTFSIEGMKLDPAFLELPKMTLMVEVTHAKAPNLPWGYLQVFAMAVPEL